MSKTRISIKKLEKIVIIDFGSQFTQLIARKVRETGVYSEIVNFNQVRNLKKNNLEDNRNSALNF